MALPPSPYRKILVEDCEVICVSTAVGNPAIYGITFEYTRAGGHAGQRQWFRCPRCGDACSRYSARPAQRYSPIPLREPISRIQFESLLNSAENRHSPVRIEVLTWRRKHLILGSRNRGLAL
jgi:hypothetical protein